MRNGDTQLFLEASTGIGQYTREGSVSPSVPIAPPAGNTDTAGASGSVLLGEKPTITYAPLSGTNAPLVTIPTGSATPVVACAILRASGLRTAGSRGSPGRPC